MPFGLYTRWELASESSKFKPRQNKRRSFENMVMSYFQRVGPECKVESFHTTGKQKKIDEYSVDDFCGHRNTVFEAMGCYCFFAHVKKLLLLSLSKNFSEALKTESWTI